MAIVKMSKFHLLFLHEARETLFKKLEAFNYVHVNALKEGNLAKELGLKEVRADEAIEKVEEKLRQVNYIIEQLEPFSQTKSSLTSLREGMPSMALEEVEKKAQAIDLPGIYAKVRRLVDEQDALEQRIKYINESLLDIEPWASLDFSLGAIEQFEWVNVHLGSISRRLFERLAIELTSFDDIYYEVIREEKQKVYLLFIVHKEQEERFNEWMIHYGFTETNLEINEKPKEAIARMSAELQACQNKIESLQEKRIAMTEHLEDMYVLYEYFTLKKNRYAIANGLLGTERMNIMDGYIPTEYVDTFKEMLREELGDYFYLEITEANLDDTEVPILLENKKLAKPFESVTEMYALPKYNELDPTPLFSFFYAIFFGMMIGDAGYGIVMWLLSVGILKALRLTDKQRNFFQFFYYLSYTTIFWGLIFGSFFGDLLSLPAVIDTNKDYNLLLILSIILGAFHVFFALGIQAYIEIKRKNVLNAIFDVGFWYLLLGSLAVLLLSLTVESFAPYRTASLIVMVGSMVGILLTGGREQATVGKKVAGGLYSLYGLTSYISDFVSYSRLMALALASGFIAYAINLMVWMLFDLGIVGVILGVIVFVVGQGFNIFLSILSSYVHTLRLTYVEFFGKFYEGGGKPFQMFRNAGKYINIESQKMK